MTFNEVTRVWVSGRPETTVRQYQRLIEHLDAEAFKLFNTRILDLKIPQVEALLRADTKNLTLSARTKCHRIWILRSFYKCAVELGVRPDNPAQAIRAPKYEDKLAERLIRHEQVMAILAHAKGEGNKLLIHLLYGAGLRVSEAIRLSRADLLGDGRIKVFGKGEKTAYVRIRPELEARLLAYCTDGYVFKGLYEGKPINRKTAYGIVKAAAVAAGLPKVSPHWFRHAHATEALRRGASLPLVQASLRHTNVITTMKYAHVIDGDAASNYLPDLSE